MNLKSKNWIIAGILALSGAGIAATALPADAPEESKTVWALLTGQLNNQAAEIGIVTYNLDSPETYTMVHRIESGNSLGAGVVVDNVFYWYEYVQQVYGYDAVGLYAYDMDEGSVRLVTSYGNTARGVTFCSPTYDYQTNTVYALNQLMAGDALVTVDLQSGIVNKVADFKGLLPKEGYTMADSFKAIAVNYDGDMYGVTYWGRLYKINKVSGECSLIGDLDFNPEEAIMYSTSLAFDNDTDELYWEVYTWVNLYKELRKINIKDATTTQIGIFGDDRLISDFYIPFTVAEASAPAKVNDFEALPDAQGALGVTLSWENPTRTYGRGGTLESLDKIEIYRDNELVETLENPTIGAAMSWHDDVPASDLYTYKVIPYNEAGKGDRCAATVFIGHGIPLPVTNLKLEPSDNYAKLTWTAPVNGKFDAYLDPETLCYEIVRSDDVTVASEFKGTEFIDDSIETLARYSYRVKAKAIGGESEEVISDAVVCGPAVSLPTSFTFATRDEFDLWTVIDGNGDETSWYWSTWPTTCAQSAMSYYYPMPAHEYLISPKVKMESGKHYKVSFDATGGNKNVTEIVAVSFGSEPTPQLQDSVNQYEIRSDVAVRLRASLPVVSKDGDYNFGFVHRSYENNYNLKISNIVVEEDHDGSLKGTVTCDGKPVNNARIATEDGQYFAFTDEKGNYRLEYLPQDTYTLIVSAIGYEELETEVYIAELTVGQQDFVLEALPQYTVSGKVTDSVDDPVENARVTLGGYNSYETYTDAQGFFSIEGVFQHDAYSLVIERNNLLSHSETLDVNSNVDCGEITLLDNLKAPYRVTVEESAAGVEVQWAAPLNDPREVRYDDGVFNQSLGITYNSSAVFGNVSRVPSVLYGCQFYVMGTADVPNHYSVYLYVFDLDANGNPTNKILYNNTYVPVTDDEWTTFTFPQPIDCPNGYMIGISHYSFASLAIDGWGDKEEWPFVEKVNCYCSDYTTGEWAYLEETEFKANFAMRSLAAAYGGESNARWIAPKDMATTAPSVMPQLYTAPEDYVVGNMNQPLKKVEDRIRYNLYRGLESDEIEWKQIASEIKERSYSDTEWNSLPQGVYRYSVEAVYAGEETSSPTVSDIIGRDMETVLNLTVTTDTPQNEADGAAVYLYGFDGMRVYSSTLDSDGSCVFENVWKQNYHLIVDKEGYQLVREDIDLSSDDSYTLNVDMFEDRVAPSNVMAIEDENDDAARLIVWNFPNLISDGFEGHEDFAIHSAGKAGWQYIDGDGAETGALYGYTWPGQFEPMAFMVFNPYTTSPSCDVMGIYPSEGSKLLAAFASYGVANDDWFISPRLYFQEDFRFSFYAESMSYYALETIQVGYSETGCEPEDFIWIDENRQVQGYWMDYTYYIPASAKYVTIHCISDQCTMLMIDNVRIGLNSEFNNGYYAPARKPLAEGTYEIYLDNEFVDSTADNSYLLNNLTNGHHTVSVRAAYTSGYSDFGTVEFDVTDGPTIVNINTSSIVNVGFDGKVVTIKGDYDSASLYSVGGVSFNLDNSKNSHDLSYLPKGVYVLTVNYDGKTITRKINVR